MALRNIDHFIDTTEHHIEQLINIAADIEGAREVPGIMYAVYYLTRSKEAAEKIKEERDGNKTETGTKEGTPSGDGTRTAKVRTSKRKTSDVGDSQ